MAGRATVVLSDLKASILDLQREVRERAPDVARRVVRPKAFEKFEDGTTRVSQIVALLFLGPVVVVSFALLTVFNSLMTDVLGGWDSENAQTGLFQWLVTALTLGAFILAAWSWFQFVRTSGFGFFAWSD